MVNFRVCGPWVRPKLILADVIIVFVCLVCYNSVVSGVGSGDVAG